MKSEGTKKTARKSASAKKTAKARPARRDAPKSSAKGAGNRPVSRAAGGRPKKAEPAVRRPSPAARAKASAPRPRLAIPPLLLEGDEPPPPPVSGPGHRYALFPTLTARGAGESAEVAELPESYGTERLFLTARDPHWLYAHWDLTREQQREYNRRSVDRHLVLRVFRNGVEGEPFREIHLQPESRSWFAHVGLGGTKYVAQLGYYAAPDQWVAIATSGATLTPPDSLSEDVSVWFETMPSEVQHEHLLEIVKSAVSEHLPLMEALAQLRASGFEGLPASLERVTPSTWTPAQEKALASVITMDAVRRVWMGSLEITELLRRQMAQEWSSAAAAGLAARPPAELAAAGAGGVSSVSSPYGGAPAGKGFWFNVNAELVIYGATEPDAEVTIGGRSIRLRPDGTFSYRFALPDGHYELPVVAVAASRDDRRAAELRFTRSTQYHGHVERHAQDEKLRPPLAEHVS